MDIQLPVIDGYEAALQIKADPTLANTPIIAVSSFVMKATKRRRGSDGLYPFLEEFSGLRSALRLNG